MPREETIDIAALDGRRRVLARRRLLAVAVCSAILVGAASAAIVALVVLG